MHKGFVETLCTACIAFEYTTTRMLINSTLFFYPHGKRKMFDVPVVALVVYWTLVRHDVVGDKKTRHNPPKIRVFYLCGWCVLTLTWDVLYQSYCPVGCVAFQPRNTGSFCTKNEGLRCFGTVGIVEHPLSFLETGREGLKTWDYCPRGCYEILICSHGGVKNYWSIRQVTARS